MTIAAVTLSLATTGGIATAANHQPAADQQVSYLGLTFSVPAGWPVVTLGPTTCVRFDQHAVYLGTPGQQMNCPSGLSGRTEALLVQPATGTAKTATDNATGHQLTGTAPGATITATYGSDQALAQHILTSAGLPAATEQATPRLKPNALPNARLNATALPANVTNGTGEGFDACTAPSSAQMSGWTGSYTNIGIYIGGSDLTCAQPNLTASWVSAQAAAGWHFMPLYVGPQALKNELSSPQTQGTSSADDAMARAAGLGIGPGNILYFDMEAYTPATQGAAALAFEAAWTSELHRGGYWSGIYGSNNSVVDDLVANYGGTASPDVIFDGKWDGADNTSLPVLPSADWAGHQRIHQYVGGIDETHGGYQINIDKDVLDVAQAGAAATANTSTYVPSGPTRVLDTRNTGSLGANGVATLSVFSGTSVPTNATSVVVNVTAVNPTMAGYLTVYPDGDARPASSNLNFTPGQIISNLVTVPVVDGKVDFYNFQGGVDVIADLFGYYVNGGSGDKFVPAGPSRLLDTRSNNATIPAGGTYTLPVAGVAGIPADATAVVLNVTAVNAGAGFLTVYPDGGTRPIVSNINYSGQPAIPNLVIVPVNNGNIDFYSQGSSVDVAADLFGYYVNGTGSSFTPAGPARLLDTRAGNATLGQGGIYRLPVAGNSGVPAGVTAVVLNVTVTNATAASYLTVYPDSAQTTVPSSSNLNFSAGQTVPNLVIVPVTDGKVDFYNFRGQVDVIADLFGYFTG